MVLGAWGWHGMNGVRAGRLQCNNEGQWRHQVWCRSVCYSARLFSRSGNFDPQYHSMRLHVKIAVRIIIGMHSARIPVIRFFIFTHSGLSTSIQCSNVSNICMYQRRIKPRKPWCENILGPAFFLQGPGLPKFDSFFPTPEAPEGPPKAGSPGALPHWPRLQSATGMYNNNDKIVAISNVVHKKKGNHYGDTVHWYIHVLYIKYENYYVENDVRSIHYRFIHAFMGWLRSPCIQLHPVF